MHQSARIHPGVGRVAIDQSGQDHEGVALPARDGLNARRIAPLGGGQASGSFVVRLMLELLISVSDFGF